LTTILPRKLLAKVVVSFTQNSIILQRKRNDQRKKETSTMMMHNELVSPNLPPPLPLGYEEGNKSHGFLDFIHQHPSLGSTASHTAHAHVHSQNSTLPMETLDGHVPQYANFMAHSSYHPNTADDQFYNTGRSSYPSYPYPYPLPSYPSISLDTGQLSLCTTLIDLSWHAFVLL
jgi:hypothetical protein